MWKYVPGMERYLRDLIEQLRHDKFWPRLELSIVGMGGRTGVLRAEDIVGGHSGKLARKLPVSNLSTALRLIITALTGRVTNYRVKGEVFVLLGNNPGVAKWQERAQRLEGLGVNITPIAFAFMSKSLTENLLRKLRTGTGKLFSLTGDVTDDRLRWIFLEAMVSQIKEDLATATKSLAEAKSPEKRQGKEAIVPPTVRGEEAGRRAIVVPMPRSKVVDSQGVARYWQELEPTDPMDPVPNAIVDKKDTAEGWRIVGASRRGKMHAHKGTYREDAFALAAVGDWHLMVVADGGGSCPLSRVGSQLAADTAVAAMVRQIELMGNTTLSDKEVCEIALKKGLEEAWEMLAVKANSRQVPLGHLGTTFLSVIHRPDENGSIVGVVQIGDGLVAAELAGGELLGLAEPDAGETAGVTLFLTSKHWEEWLDRVSVRCIETWPRVLAAMCDGVADDFVPFEQYLPRLLKALHEKVLPELEHPEQALLDFLAYDIRGSFDDRTVTLLYQIEHGEGR